MDNPIIVNEALPVNEEEATIQRCPHDDAYRFSIVSNNLIRDETISPECRWLIIYLLSNKAGWKINVQQVINHLKPHMGRNAVYKVFEEAITAGYLKREDLKKSFDNKGKIKSGVRYFISETPKFKESLRRPENRDADDRDTENRDAKVIPSSKKDYLEESSSLKVPEEPIAAKAAEVELKPSSKPKREKSDFSPKVREVANKLLQLVVEDSPSYIIPKNLSPFLQEVQNMLNIDKRDPELLYTVLRFSLPDPFYGPGLLNGNLAKKLRDKFVTLEKKMKAKPPVNPNQVDRRLRDEAGEVVDQYKDRMF